MVAAKEVVIGDALVLEAGDVVPADARLLPTGSPPRWSAAAAVGALWPLFAACVRIAGRPWSISRFWEILEYLSDLLFAKNAQGSPVLARLDDTMWDLILDGAGGLIGGVLGPIYMRHSKQSRYRMRAFAELVAPHL